MIELNKPMKYLFSFRTLLMLGIFISLQQSYSQEPIPWAFLKLENDLRDSEVQRVNLSMHTESIKLINEYAMLPHKVKSEVIPISKLLEVNSPMSTLHFDAVEQTTFTKAEKSTLLEYMKRGGFIVIYEDTYPYEQEVFRSQARLPIYDFFAVDLPAEDKNFVFKHIPDDHLLFKIHFKTSTHPGIQREEKEFPHYRGHNMLYYRDRPVMFTRACYGYDDGTRFIPKRRPFTPYRCTKPGCELTVNLYLYIMSH
jgi:hypothetical protein